MRPLRLRLARATGVRFQLKTSGRPHLDDSARWISASLLLRRATAVSGPGPKEECTVHHDRAGAGASGFTVEHEPKVRIYAS
jgi:hypothetical protein